jgi:hypothetical protein
MYKITIYQTSSPQPSHYTNCTILAPGSLISPRYDTALLNALLEGLQQMIELHKDE